MLPLSLLTVAKKSHKLSLRSYVPASVDQSYRIVATKCLKTPVERSTGVESDGCFSGNLSTNEHETGSLHGRFIAFIDLNGKKN